AEIRRFVTEQLCNLRNLLYQDVALARTELGKHVSRITMKPDLERRHYTAIGEWDLLGGCENSGRVRMVAGACYAAFQSILAAKLVRRWPLPRNGRRPNRCGGSRHSDAYKETGTIPKGGSPIR